MSLVLLNPRFGVDFGMAFALVRGGFNLAEPMMVNLNAPWIGP
jgi:hypothetical protein